MAFPDATPNVLISLGYELLTDFTCETIQGVITITEWSHADPQPTEQQINEWATDTTPLPSGQLFSQWLSEHGGDATITAKRLAKELYDDQKQQGRQIRAALQVVVDEFNRHSDTAHCGIAVTGQAAPQSIPAATPTIVNAWDADAEEFRATSDSANNQIILGDSGTYTVGLSIAYAHTGGAEADLTWGIYAGGTLVTKLQSRRLSKSGEPAAVTIGPLLLGVGQDNVVVDLRCSHNEAYSPNLIVAFAQFAAERKPTVPVRTFNDLKNVVLTQIDNEG